MRTETTFTILFWINSSRVENNLAIIYARVTVNGKRVNISLKRKVDITSWNTGRQRVQGTSKIAREINQYLDQVQIQLFQCFQDLKLKRELITASLIKANYLGENDDRKTLKSLTDYHKNKINSTLARGTIRNFGVTEGYIQKFLERTLKTSDIYLHQLNYKFICDFENFLYTFWPKGHPKAIGHNTVMKHIQRFRKIVTLGYHMEWIEKDPFIRWKPTYEKREREFLSANELSNIETYKFPIERLERVRDLFVFSCYTGISYVDIINLSNANVLMGDDNYNWIITTRQKTKAPVKVPLLQKAQALIDKYDNHPMTLVSGTLFPVITNEKLNLYLKEIADAAGITKNLTFHMARHTFATTITLTNGVPIETVSKLLGHTKISTTQIYARVIEKKVSEDMNILRAKMQEFENIKNANSS